MSCHEVVNAKDADKFVCRYFLIQADVSVCKLYGTAAIAVGKFTGCGPMHDRASCRWADVYCFAQDHSAQS